VKLLLGSPWTLAASLSVLVVLLLTSAQAGAQQRKPTPSASELWRDYPLEGTPEARVRLTAQATPATRENGSSASPDEAATVAGGGDHGERDTAQKVIIGVIVLVAAVATLLAWVRAGPGGAAIPGLGASRDDGTPAPPSEDAESPQRSGPAQPEQHATPLAAAPPDPGQAWTAEIEWRDTPDGPRFVFVACTDDASERVPVTESEPPDWPPKGSDSLQALKQAVDRLEAAAVSAGWIPAPAGRAWYAKRFAWQPATRLVSTGRFKSGAPWPEGTENLYRGEIVWAPGENGAAFRAMAFAPREARGSEVCTSKTFKIGPSGEPDAESEDMRSQLELMTAAMSASGWELAGCGPAWFSHRFVWRGDERPPDHVELPAATDAGGGPK